MVPTNIGLGPLGAVRGLRGLINLGVFLARLAVAVPRARVVHVFACSGLSFFLFAAPAVAWARLTGRRVIVNYRGGLADSFLARRGRWVRPLLRRAHRLVVPSGFLQQVFARHGFATEVLPNYVDLGRFEGVRARGGVPRIVVTRNLEPIYRVHDALEVFARVRAAWPQAELVVAGDGSERAALEAAVQAAGLAGVRFLGRVDNARIAEVYAGADVMLNPTGVDNMPVSVLEAFAAGVPVVSTAAGGVPFLVEDGVTGLLAGVGDVAGLTAAVRRVLEDDGLAERLVSAARERVSAFALERVTAAWRELYRAEAMSDG